MKAYVTLFIAALFLLTFAGCKKTELDGAYSNYEGLWNGPGIEMRLMSNGRANYTEYSGSTTKEMTNARLVIDGNELKISAFLTNKKFNIDSPPAEDESGFWYMTLDGMVFTR